MVNVQVYIPSMDAMGIDDRPYIRLFSQGGDINGAS